MSNIGPGHGFSNPAARFNAAQSAGVIKPSENKDVKKTSGPAGAAAPAQTSASGDSLALSLFSDVAPPPTFGQIAQDTVSSVFSRYQDDPHAAADELKNPELKQWLQLGYVPVTAV